jgi:methionyl-tRNA synthetase
MWEQLGVEEPLTMDLEWGKFKAGTKINKGSPLFPRIEK